MPNTIDTPQNRAAVPKAEFKKWVEPSTIAEVIQILASDASHAINGARLCENSLAAQHGKKSTLTFWLWRIFIFNESDLNHFFAFQNDRI
jgi:hypothetical protein